MTIASQQVADRPEWRAVAERTVTLARPAAADQRAERLAIGLNSGRQPERGAAEVAHAVRAAEIERLPAEGFDHLMTARYCAGLGRVHRVIGSVLNPSVITSIADFRSRAVPIQTFRSPMPSSVEPQNACCHPSVRDLRSSRQVLQSVVCEGAHWRQQHFDRDLAIERRVAGLVASPIPPAPICDAI